MRQMVGLGLGIDELVVVAPDPLPEIEFFRPALFPRQPYWRSFLASVVLHCAVIFGLPPLLDLLPESDAELWMRRMQAMRPLEIRVPDHLYFSRSVPEPQEQPVPPPKPKPVPRPQEIAKADIPPPPPKPAALRVPPRQFKPPANVRRVNSDQTLIQSHLPPDMPLTAQVKLPQLILLSSPVLPRPAPRRFVEPGKSAAPTVAPRVDAPPQLASPGADDSGLRISRMLAGPDSALLRLPRPSAPVKRFQAPAPLPSGRGASVSPNLGEPIDILALSSSPAPLGDRVTIPLGNQIGRLPNLPAYSEEAPAGAAAKAGVSGGTGPEGSSSKGGSSATGSPGGSGQGATTAGGLAEFARALAALPQRYATPIRIEHPVNAIFDIVVVQSATDAAFAESAGVLTGQPVYTVYLQVGSPRAWVLQYCIPGEKPQADKVSQSMTGVVNIGASSPVKAPFPLVTVLPPVTMLPRAGYIIVHGSVDTSGQFKNLVILRAPNARMNDLVLSDLGKWQFRPAVRDGVPVAVEILLAIPPQEV